MPRIWPLNGGDIDWPNVRGLSDAGVKHLSARIIDLIGPAPHSTSRYRRPVGHNIYILYAVLSRSVGIPTDLLMQSIMVGPKGSFPLTNTDIDANAKNVSPGAYALGYTKGNTFYIDYVGRSDVDVAGRLKDHVGKYKRFKYGYFSTAKAAFEKECRLYHDFSPKDNDIHPARPANSGWECPVCTVFD